MIFWIILVQAVPKRVRYHPVWSILVNPAIFTYQAGGSPEVVESEESERLDETLRLRSEIVRIKAQGASLGFPIGPRGRCLWAQKMFLGLALRVLSQVASAASFRQWNAR
jgi:hypothetical protein